MRDYKPKKRYQYNEKRAEGRFKVGKNYITFDENERSHVLKYTGNGVFEDVVNLKKYKASFFECFVAPCETSADIAGFQRIFSISSKIGA